MKKTICFLWGYVLKARSPNVQFRDRMCGFKKWRRWQELESGLWVEGAINWISQESYTMVYVLASYRHRCPNFTAATIIKYQPRDLGFPSAFGARTCAEYRIQCSLWSFRQGLWQAAIPRRIEWPWDFQIIKECIGFDSDQAQINLRHTLSLKSSH